MTTRRASAHASTSSRGGLDDSSQRIIHIAFHTLAECHHPFRIRLDPHDEHQPACSVSTTPNLVDDDAINMVQCISFYGDSWTSTSTCAPSRCRRRTAAATASSSSATASPQNDSISHQLVARDAKNAGLGDIAAGSTTFPRPRSAVSDQDRPRGHGHGAACDMMLMPGDVHREGETLRVGRIKHRFV